MKTIFAFTEVGYQHNYPGYVNLSEVPDGIRCTVRAPGSSMGQELTLPDETARELYLHLKAHYAGTCMG